MTREITHMKAFTAALESLGKDRFTIGLIAPTPGLTNQYFNDSTGQGDEGEMDARGPWNQGGEWEFVTSPVVSRNGAGEAGPEIKAERSESGEPEVLRELFIEELQDILSAEGQILKAMPRMIKSVESPALRAAFEIHMEETKAQVERIKEAFQILGVTQAKGKVCKGMAGLIEEGKEMIEESKDKESVAKDLALIGAAQKIEHYEISAYGTARVMAQQLGQPDIAQLLSKSLAEEENADSVLTDCAKPLISEAKLAEIEP
jgi:Mn-containing catalase